MTTFAVALARTTEHPSDYVIFVILGMAVLVFGVLTAVGVWFLTAEPETVRPRRKRLPKMDPSRN